ncbi:hypothetical protein GCM10009715_21400 [Paeniglutamicibacter psychrophenolicus]|uniref:Uncharacterized protein n=1 Tax=Paeniglutamicibacter psychrophenolicus TaxID=257454 RepID=A0ABS4WH83_9MICC|nr:hypothetical protein [Paeniglutamicibacter psychrophenolicus]MBP2375576.1 hypothetical protein [Paeniglutamicibacter psychrophenolicus]
MSSDPIESRAAATERPVSVALQSMQELSETLSAMVAEDERRKRALAELNRFERFLVVHMGAKIPYKKK